jgi:hypothetical protein
MGELGRTQEPRGAKAAIGIIDGTNEAGISKKTGPLRKCEGVAGQPKNDKSTASHFGASGERWNVTEGREKTIH